LVELLKPFPPLVLKKSNNTMTLQTLSNMVLYRPAQAVGSTTETGYYIIDRHTNIPAITSHSGDITTGYTYSDYGNVTATGPQQPTNPGERNPFTYTSAYTNWETDTYHLNARTYTPATKTFTTPDSEEVPHLYGYTEGRPITKTDPTGHATQDDDKKKTQAESTSVFGTPLFQWVILGVSFVPPVMSIGGVAHNYGKNNQKELGTLTRKLTLLLPALSILFSAGAAVVAGMAVFGNLNIDGSEIGDGQQNTPSIAIESAFLFANGPPPAGFQELPQKPSPGGVWGVAGGDARRWEVLRKFLTTG
jgi:RHS repeat-associated protein